MGKGVYMVRIESAYDTDQSQTGEVGSVGALGIEARSHERYVLTSPWGMDVGLDNITHALKLGIGIIDRNRAMNGSGSEFVSRCVGRFLIRDGVMNQIAQNPQLLSHLEVAIPIVLNNEYIGFQQDRAWLAVLAVNHPSRQSILPLELMIRQIQEDQS